MEAGGWVTNPEAIDVVVALKEILPGDEIRIKNAANYNISVNYEGQVVVVEGYRGAGYMLGESSQETCMYAGHPVVFFFSGAWVGCRENIAAWRRPSALKK